MNNLVVRPNPAHIFTTALLFVGVWFSSVVSAQTANGNRIAFPNNVSRLNSRSCIVARKDLFLKGYPLFAGDTLKLAWDGKKVRCQSFEWDLLELCEDLHDGENWILESN